MNNKKDACQTYIEQTKLFVSLASLFVLAPLGLMSVSDKIAARLADHLGLASVAEFLFAGAVLIGYLTLGSLAGSQDAGTYDVYRPATRTLSVLSVLCYLSGLVAFIELVRKVNGG